MRIIKIGKDKSNDIFKELINDPTVSRIHCQIFMDDEGNKFLKDMGSTNGTYVNGNRISEPHKLDDYDVIKAGNSVIDWKGFLMSEDKEVNDINNTISDISSSNSDSESITKQFEKLNGVKGWLLLLCLILTIFSPLATLFNLTRAHTSLFPLFDDYPSVQNLFYIDSLISLVVMVFSIRAGNALWNIKPRAVEIAKNYLFIFLGYTVFASFLPFIIGLPSQFNNDLMINELIKGSIKSFIFFGIWYSYLNFSKRVKATYKSSEIKKE